MKITIERNIADDSIAERFPYIARIQIINATKDRGHVYQTPIYVKYKGIQRSFGVDVCGFHLEEKKPHDLIPQIEGRLRRLISAARLPHYAFIARRARVIYPVYTIGDEVVALTGMGPMFRHVELAKVRKYLTEFLHDINILGEKGKSDKLHVRGISVKTLGLRRPVFYLKKRIPNEEDFWAPVFQSGDSRQIYAYAASERREVSRLEGQPVLALQRLVAEALQRDERLTHPHDLRPDRLMPAYWESLRETLTPAGEMVVNGVTLPLFENGRLHLAVEERPNEERYGLFLGESVADVQRRAQQDFDRRAIGG